MTLFKNTLLFIIAIQVMVLLQILTIQQYELEQTFNKLTTPLSFNPFTKKSPLTPEEYQFFSTLSTSAEVKLEKHKKNLLQNKFFTVGQGHIQRAIKDDVESTAKDLLGTPYVWGATGPNKFDCSGFTQEVFCQAGIRIPRNSRAQAKVGKHVEYEELKRGDMVFFDTNRKTPGRVTHVGIYLSEGKFIHASSGGRRVIISSLIKSNYYKNHFLWGRRIIRDYKIQHIPEKLTLNKLKETIVSL